MAASGCSLSESPKKSTQNWFEYHDLIPRMVPYPCVLNRPVLNLDAHCNEIGLEPEGDPSLLFDILSWIVGENYHADLMPWIQMHQSLLVGPKHWLRACGLSFDQYLENMAAEGQCDGLEVWLVSLVMGCLINVVQDNLIWSTGREGVNFTQAMLILTSYASSLCRGGTISNSTGTTRIPMCEEDWW